MPTIFTERGFRFFFFSGDDKEPMHVHVEKAESYAKFWLKPVALAVSGGFKPHELREIRMLIEQHKDELEERWNAHFRFRRGRPR